MQAKQLRAKSVMFHITNRFFHTIQQKIMA